MKFRQNGAKEGIKGHNYYGNTLESIYVQVSVAQTGAEMGIKRF